MGDIEIKLTGICGVEGCDKKPVVLRITRTGQVFELCEEHKNKTINYGEKNGPSKD